VHVTAKDLLAIPEAPSPKRACAECRRRHSVSRSLAARQRLRADLQPDGRRRHGGDFARKVWQWVKHGAKLQDGRTVTAELVGQAIDEQSRSGKAAELFKQMTTNAEFPEFLTLLAYDCID
jgi:malate synthase